MRIFAGIPLTDPGITNRLIEFSGEFKRRLPECRWTLPANLHLTVRFYGETDAGEIPMLRLQVTKACRLIQPAPLMVAGLGSFVRRDRAVFYLALKSENDWLEDLARALGDDGSRPFTPHITIGRLKTSRLIRARLAEFNEQYLVRGESLTGMSMTDLELVLYQSELTPAGPVYTSLARWPLPYAIV